MPDFIGYGSRKLQKESDKIKEDRDYERNRTEALVIEHIEKATNTKLVTVDGEPKYIPKAEAKKLGLI